MNLRRRGAAIAAVVAALMATAAAPGQSAAPTPPPPVAGPSLVEVAVGSPAAMASLQGFDLAEARHGDRVQVVLWPGDAARLAQLGLGYRTLIADLAAHDRAVRADDLATAGAATAGRRTSYRHLADYEAELRSLAERFPGHVRLVEGPYPTYEGRTVLGVEIAADVASADGRPTAFIMGLHHAREWPSGEVTMDLAVELAEKFGTDARITAALQAARVLLVPVVNPDGFIHSRETPAETPTGDEQAAGVGAYWRKNRRGIAPSTAGANPTAYGVDPNRNYGYRWGGGDASYSGASPLPAHLTYQGEAPFSEAETSNVRHWVLSRPVTTLITNHTFSNLVLWPWGHTHEDAPDAPMLRQLGTAMASINRYRPMQGIELYPTTGTTEDWAYGVTGTLGYTFEIGTEFHPRYGRVPDLYADNRNAYLLLIEAAADVKRHSVITGSVVDASGQPVAATLRLTRTTRTPANFVVDRSFDDTVDMTTATLPDGTFAWHVNPSTPPGSAAKSWVLTASAPGHAPVSVAVPIGRGQSATVQLVLR